MKRKDPHGFYNEQDFNYEVDMFEEFITIDNRFTIKLLQVDMVNSVTNDIYGSSFPEDKKFHPPIELPSFIVVGEFTNDYWDGTNLKKETNSEFSCSIMNKHLDEHGIVIRPGDIFVYHDGSSPRAYEVTTNTNIDTNNTMNGFKPFYKTITGVLVKSDVIPSEYIK
jgi:hypothetical protein